MKIENGLAVIEKRDDVDIEELKDGLADRVELELLAPKEIGGEMRDTLVFEEPTGDHIDLMFKAGSQKAQGEVSWRIMGDCVGLSAAEVRTLGGRDIARLTAVLSYFLPDVRAGRM
ncbi:phage tail assembly protein [Natronospirillum operosum]|uniref:Phage tail assembly protein n=1 Tax=Natronospirillum operosum TaxID=2759953 RepID=A0A4Z0W7G4_9GAMM|nr:phage tail assembly protein [Natronospirillum operosum]TGG92532.1 phage tail assembly protein [Natronospirillum operosum]